MAELVWQKANNLADKMRQTYDLSTPIDPYEICEALDITVFFAPIVDDVSGIIVKKKDQSPEIAINSRHRPMRQRFTLAHELGHYVERTEVAGDADFSFSDARGTKYDLHEFFADEFAAALLMPTDEVTEFYKKDSSILALSNHFQVSVDAARMRISKLKKRELL